MRKVTASVIALLGLTGCTTELQSLELRNAQLQQIEKAATQVNSDVLAGQYDPAKYDLYLLLNRSIFDQLLKGFGGTTSQFTADGRQIDVTFTSMALAFNPGSPAATIAATATDAKRSITAGINLEARLLVESDPATPGAIYLKAVVTNIVPSVTLGHVDVTAMKLIRSLLALKLTQFTEKLPRITLPVDRQFAMGGPGGVRATGQIPTGNGSWITGNLSYPGSQLSGQISVQKILFLSNGVHLFANVEGL